MLETQLSPEERYLWACARCWRNPRPPVDPAALDWAQLVKIALANRMATLLDRVLQQTAVITHVPAAARQELAEGVEKYQTKTRQLGDVVRQYMPLAAQQNIDTMPMKGLWVSYNLYGVPAMRPGHDLDVLVRREQIQACVSILERLHFGRYWPDLMPDAFYERHHLHLELSLPDCWTWVEVHWAFDHPRTLLTIDYDAVMARTTPGELLGAPVRNPSLPDLLLYLAVHLVKHAVYLPAVLDRPDLAKIIVADKRLMYFLDVAEAVRQHEATLDWALVVQLAQEYGAVDILGSVLQVCRDHLAAPVPDWVLAELVINTPNPVTRWVMNGMVNYMLDIYAGRKGRRRWRFLLEPNWMFVFRPIRLLDFMTYLFPGSDYLKRKYGQTSGTTAVTHLLRAISEYALLGKDTLYYLWQRKRHPLPVFMTAPASGSLRLESGD